MVERIPGVKVAGAKTCFMVDGLTRRCNSRQGVARTIVAGDPRGWRGVGDLSTSHSGDALMMLPRSGTNKGSRSLSYVDKVGTVST